MCSICWLVDNWSYVFPSGGKWKCRKTKTTFWQTNENSTLNFEPLWASFISPLKVCNKLKFFSLRWQIFLQDIKKHSFHNPSNKKNIYKFYLKCRFCFQKIKLSCHVFCPVGNECMRSFFLTILTFAFFFIRLCKLQAFSSTSFAFHDLFLRAKRLSLYLEIYMKNRLCLWIWSMYVQFVIFDV